MVRKDASSQTHEATSLPHLLVTNELFTSDFRRRMVSDDLINWSQDVSAVTSEKINTVAYNYLSQNKNYSQTIICIHNYSEHAQYIETAFGHYKA